MRNERADRRKKKLAERLRPAGRGKGVAEKVFDFALDTQDGDPEFVRVVTAALARFDFTKLPHYHQTFLREVHRFGAEQARRNFQKFQARATVEYPNEPLLKVTDVALDCGIGAQVFADIPEAQLRQFLPVNDVEFLPFGHVVLVKFRSLLRAATSGGATYFSRYKPCVTFGGRKYIVGFSKHAIDQTGERINPDWMTYAGLGDLFAYFDQCVHFEPCHLRDGSPAVTFYDEIPDERFWHHRYLVDVLEVSNYVTSKGPAYYRVGYCPVVFVGAFAKATTLLFPGFSKTPEYVALQRSRLPWPRKERLAALAIKSDATHLQQAGDFSAIKWFHDHGVIQVFQTTDEMFKR